MPFRIGVFNIVEFAVFIVRDSLAVVVGLDFRRIVPNPFPVNFIQIVRLQDHTTDNTTALCHLSLEFEDTKEDVEGGLDRRRLEFLRNREFGALIGVVDLAISHVPDLVVEGLIKAPGVVGSQRRVGFTVLVGGIAVRPCLGNNRGDRGR